MPVGALMLLFLLANWKGLVLGFIAGAAALFVYGVAVTSPTARQQGQNAERVVWQDAQRRAEAKAEADRVSAQAAIDRIEADYHQREAERSAQMTALDQALQEAQAHEPAPTPGASCRPVIPHRVLDSLDAVGRPAPRVDSAGPHAGLP